MDFNYKEKVDAQNTYTLKLCTTHAANYTEAPALTPAVGNLYNNLGDQNAFKPYWYLPVIGGNHIENCLMRVTRVTIPAKCFNFNTGVGGQAQAEVPQDFVRITDDSLYIECDSVINKSFVTNSSRACILKGVVGSINTTECNNWTNHEQGFMGYKFNSNATLADKNDWILASNPFGSAFHLSLIRPSDFTSPTIKATLKGTADDQAANGLQNYPIVYELEIKLLPDHNSNDKATY